MTDRRPRPPHRPLVQGRGRPNGVKRAKPVEVRTCRRHGETEFGLYGATPRTQAWKCKRCIAERVTLRHQRVKRILVEEAGGCCVLCGYDRCIVSLQFHHVDPETKSFRMACSTGKALDTYREEAKKCVLVCANCHAEIETGMVPSPPAGMKFDEMDHTYSHPALDERSWRDLQEPDARDASGRLPLDSAG